MDQVSSPGDFWRSTHPIKLWSLESNMASKCHKPLPLSLLFLVILCRIELICCCSGSDDGGYTTKTCEAGELGGGMIDGKFIMS